MGKGQVTIFIIIGLVIVLSVGLVFFFKKESVPASHIVPSDVQPVDDYVTGCIDQIGRDGLTLLGAQGGYITLPSIIDRNPNAHVRADPQGVVKTAFWYYDGEDRTPSLEFMERELAVYVKENLPICINRFEPFAQSFTIRERGALLPIVQIADKQVIVTVKWPLEIASIDKVTPVPGFSKVFPVRLKEMWSLADKTMKKENELGWFENLTIDLMSTNPDIPLSGMEFACGVKKWRIEEVRSALKETLQYNLPAVRVENTRVAPALASEKTYDQLRAQGIKIRASLEAGKDPVWPENVPDDVFEVNRMRFDVGVPTTDLKAAFMHQAEWPLLVNAQPSSGGTLSSGQMKGARKYLRFLCINQWHFAYDVVYPVQMLIRDDGAFNDEGFVFGFAFPVIIEDNAESRLFFGARKFVAPETGADFCSTFGEGTTDIRVLGFPQGAALAEELEDANITYRCLNQECVLGRTLSDGTGPIHLSTYLPQGCGNPTIIAQKEGYLAGRASVKDVTEVFLQRVKTFNYTIVVHPYYEEVSKENPFVAKDKRWLEDQVYTTFTKTMRATISVSARNVSFDQDLLYEWTGLPNRSNTIGFVAEDTPYDVNIMLFKGETPAGGYHAENITISYEKVAANNNVQFHVVEYRPLPVQGYEQAGLFSFLYDRGVYVDGSPYEKALRPTFTP